MEDKIKQLESENARLRDALKKMTEHCEAALRVTDEIKDLLEKDKTAADDAHVTDEDVKNLLKKYSRL